MTVQELAKKCYEQFSKETRLHKDVGLSWDELPELVREAWRNVVRRFYTEGGTYSI